jgi:DNA repair protein RadB
MQSRRVGTGARVLDRLLDGGYESDAITTIYGPAGSGKTNLALLAAVEVAKSGKKVIFIDTEGGFSVHRLKQVMPEYKRILDRIVFLRPTTFEEQKKAIETLAELVSSKVGLIVVDTITMLYRLERTVGEGDSNKELGLQIASLNRICRTKGIPILMTSQVYSRFDDSAIHVVGGDLIKYGSKCLLELQPLHTKRRVILKKHRSIPSEGEGFFHIVERGIEEITPQ